MQDVHTADVAPTMVFPFKVPRDGWLVQDADEEVFLLYTQLQSSGTASQDAIDLKSSGLGSVDSKQGELALEIVYGPSKSTSKEPTKRTLPAIRPTTESKRRKSMKSSRKKKAHTTASGSLEVILFQDTTGLRSRKGDTGSVLWRASVHLARCLLSQLHYPSGDSILDSESLRSCEVLELGSGTGILSIILGPFVKRFIATDLPYLIPLIQKNQRHNISADYLSRVTAEELDWIQIQDTPDHLRRRIFDLSLAAVPVSPPSSPQHKHTQRNLKTHTNIEKLSQERSHLLIMAVDCIFNPALIPPLLTTINYLASTAPTTEESRYISVTVLVVLELRSEDVTRQFVEKWMAMPGNWEIWSVPLLGPKFVLWIGRQRTMTA